MNLAQKLQAAIKGMVLTDGHALEHYSRDWSLFQVMPEAVVIPKDAEDLETLVRFVNENKDKNLSLTPRAAGTDMSGGPLNESIIVDVKNLNKIKEIVATTADGGECYAIVQPGVYYRDFENETLKRGVIFPSYPASKSLCALGGIIANNSGGEKSLTYGKTERYVQQITMILCDGKSHVFKPVKKEDIVDEFSKQVFSLVDTNYELIKKSKPTVSKNSTGYNLWNVWDRERNIFDMTQLFVGSQGTLGIWTEAKVTLVQPKEHSALLVLMLDARNMKALGNIVKTVLTHQPESFESYDDHTFKIAVKFLPSMIRSMGAGNLISLAFQFLPEVWMALTGGVPKLVLVAEFTGDSEEEIYMKARAAEKDLKRFGIKTRIAKNDQEENKYWTIRRQSFKLLTDHSKGKRTVPFIDDIVVSPEYLPEFLPKLQEIMSHYDLEFTIAGHIGDGNFHIIPLDKIGDEKLKTVVPELSQKVFDLVFQYHGSMSGEHNDGIVRTPFLKQMYGPEIYGLFEEVKRIFDPNNIFNPGKKACPAGCICGVGGTLEYEVAHIDTDPTRHFAGDQNR